MAQDAQLISQAGQVESLASDGLVSVSTGAGQPQKNMELAKFADSLGSSVPLQQTSEQVAITGLYARTSDGKMVELTKESVADVVSGLIGWNGFLGQLNEGDLNDIESNGYAYFAAKNVANSPSEESNWHILRVNALKDGYGKNTMVYQEVSTPSSKLYLRFKAAQGLDWSAWQRIDNFGYNTLAELSSGVAEQMGLKGLTYIGSGYKTINTSGGYSFSIKSKTAIVVAYDSYYGTFNSFLVTEKGTIKSIVSSTETRFELQHDGDASFTVRVTSGNYGAYISVLQLGN